MMKRMKPIIPANWQVADAFRQRLGSSYGRQRLMESDGQLLLVLHAVPQPGDADRAGRLLWRDASGTWHSSDLGAGPAALHKHLDQYAAALDQYEESEHAAQAAQDYLELLEGLTPVVRAVRNMMQVLQEARDAMKSDRDLIDARDRAYDLTRQAELLVSDAKVAMDVAVIRRAEQQAEASERMAVASHRLNVLAAFFFPIATLAAVLSTGLTDGWDWSKTSAPFVVFLVSGVLMGAVITAWVTRKHRVGG